MPDEPASMKKLNMLWNRNVLVMADFNDSPYACSVLEELQAASGCDKIEEAVNSGRTESIEDCLHRLRHQSYRHTATVQSTIGNRRSRKPSAGDTCSVA